MTPQTGLVPELAAEAPRAAENRLVARPAWILSGQVGLIVAMFVGFHAAGDLEIAPKVGILALFVCVSAMIALSPTGRVHSFVLSVPVMAILGWWLASYLWTLDAYGWWIDTQALVPLVLACVVIAGLLPGRDLRGALVAGCMMIVAYTVFKLVTDPGGATANPDGVPGWRGGFPHKNAMAPFMVFAVLTLACFARPGLRRNLTMVTASGLVVASQSTTSLATGLVVLAVCGFLWRHSVAEVSSKAAILVAGAGAALGAVVLGVLYSPVLLELRGKDATLTSRTDIWDGVWAAIIERPWLGHGAGGVWINPGSAPARNILRDLGFIVWHSHNGFLEVLLLLGIVGLALWMWLMASTVRHSLRWLPQDPAFSIFAIGLVVLMLAYSFAEVAMFGMWLALLCAVHGVLLTFTGRTADDT